MRDPYPFPQLENDQTFTGSKPTMLNSSKRPQQLGTSGVHCRLSETQTLASLRRMHSHEDDLAPADSLDFQLKAEYDHHREYSKPKNEMLLQKETLGLPHGRILKNRIVNVAASPLDLDHPLRSSVAPTRESAHSMKKAIEGCHTQTTNRGYSRKPDGGYFTA